MRYNAHRSVCCGVCAFSRATWLMFTGVRAPSCALLVQCPGPLGSCLPVCPLSVLGCLCVVVPVWCPTFGEETFEIPHGEMDWASSAQSSEWEPDWVSAKPTPLEKPKEHECLRPGSNPRAVVPEPTSLDRRLPPQMGAPKLGLDETMELLSRVLRAGDEDPDLSALSAALKTKLGLSDLKKPPPTMSPGVDLLTRDVKSCRGIRSSPMDTCPSPFQPSVSAV